MEIKQDYDVSTLQYIAWGGAEDVLDRIMHEDKEDEFMDLFEQIFYDRVPDLTEVNDWLRFEWEDIFDYLGIEGDY